MARGKKPIAGSDSNSAPRLMSVGEEPELPVGLPESSLRTVRMSVRHGFQIPEFLVRNGRKFRVLKTERETVGMVMPVGTEIGLYPLADVTLIDELTLKVIEVVDMREDLASDNERLGTI